MEHKKRLQNEGVMNLVLISEKEWQLMDSRGENLLKPLHVIIKGETEDGAGGRIRVTIYITKSIHSSSYRLETKCKISGNVFGENSKDGTAYSKIVSMQQKLIDKNAWTLIGYSVSASGGKLPLMVFYSPFLDPQKKGICFYCYKDKDESDESFYGRFGNFKPSDN